MSSQIPLSCADITDREIRAASDALRSEQLVLGPWTRLYTSMTKREVEIVSQTLELMLARGTFFES